MLLLALLLGCAKVSDGLNAHLRMIEKHAAADDVSFSDKLFLQVFFRGGIAGGAVVVPPASRILRRCINGSSRNLTLHSRYISHRSPKIKESLGKIEHKPDGTYHFGGFKQSEDYKLSMAFNPYNITLSTVKGKRYATVWLDFDWPEIPNSQVTNVPIGPMNIRINDGLVHVISDCPSYRVERTWRLKDK